MKCNDLIQVLDDYIADKVDVSVDAQIVDHLAECEACRERARLQKEYFVHLAAFNAPKLDSSRTARMLRLAVEEGEKKQSSKKQSLSFMRGFAAASILAVAVAIGINTLKPTDNALVVAGASDLQHEISLVINVPQDIDGAQLILDLPADISIQGLEHLARVEWPVDLKKGSNIIELPINIGPYAEFAEQLTLSASIVYKDKKRDFELDINLASPQNNVHGQFFESLPVRIYYV